MAGDQSIEYMSEKFISGIDQFKENISSILEDASKNKIHVVIGTLTSNLKDQIPFSSLKSKIYPTAVSVFFNAQNELLKGNKLSADSLFRLAKDLDALRFRAPEVINILIKELSTQYKCTLINVDSAFAAQSPDGIVGNNLMVDHLHPTLRGYLYLGKIYFEGIKKYLPESEQKNLNDKQQDSIVVSRFAFSKLDSAISKIRIVSLKNDWPFKPNRDFSFLNEIKLKNVIDSLAYKVAFENFDWSAAHKILADNYRHKDDFENYGREMSVLFSQFPFILNYGDNAVYGFLQSKKYDDALQVLLKRNKIKEDDFSLKWIGNIYLMNGGTQNAVLFLEKSIKYINNDPQIYFNLAVAYQKLSKNETALAAIERCLAIDAKYPNAAGLMNDLKQILFGNNQN